MNNTKQTTIVTTNIEPIAIPTIAPADKPCFTGVDDCNSANFASALESLLTVSDETFAF